MVTGIRDFGLGRQDTQAMEYRREIDGLRALAVVPVILFHAGFQTFSGGFVGVDVFFVISGYLITSLILAEKLAGTFSLMDFYERRARRILPALFVVMLASLSFAWLCLLPQDMKRFSQSLVAMAAFSSNILFWLTSGYFDTGAELKPLLHTWSLAVEEQYYVFFPIFLILTWRCGKRWILAILGLAAVASLALTQWGAVAQPAFAFFMLPTRCWELLVGAFTAFYAEKQNDQSASQPVSQSASMAGLLLICIAIFLFDKNTPFPSVYALVPTIGAGLVILYATPPTLIGKLLSSKVVVGVGLVSYSAYLWHQPLLAFAHHRSDDDLSNLLLLSLCVMSFVLAYISWNFVEKPFRAKNKFTRKSIFILGFVGSLFFFVIGLSGHLSKGFPFRVDAITATLDNPNMEIFESRVAECWSKFDERPNIDSACLLGQPEGARSFALLGDSHAGSLLHEVSANARKLEIGGLNFSYRSCPPLKRLKPVPFFEGDMVCWRLRQSFFDDLSKTSIVPNTIVISARWALLVEKARFRNREGGNEVGSDWVWNLRGDNLVYSEAMGNEIVESVQLILKTGRKVILVYPVPEMGWQVPTYLAKKYWVNQALSDADGATSYSTYLQRNKRAMEVLDSLGERDNLIRVRPDKILCDSVVKMRCVSHLRGEPLYVDNNHLSNVGAKLIVDEIMKHIGK